MSDQVAELRDLAERVGLDPALGAEGMVRAVLASALTDTGVEMWLTSPVPDLPGRATPLAALSEYPALVLTQALMLAYAEPT